MNYESPLNYDPRQERVDEDGNILAQPGEVAETDAATAASELRGDHPATMTETEAAIAEGQRVARDYMKNPDQYGADWPSATINKRARLGSRASTGRTLSSVPPAQSAPTSLSSNPEGRSQGALLRQQQIDSNTSPMGRKG